MKHIKSWQERVQQPASDYTVINALREEVAELREYITMLEQMHKMQLDIAHQMADAKSKMSAALSYEARQQALFDRLLKQVYNPRSIRSVKQLRIRREELRDLRNMAEQWMFEKTEDIGTMKFNGVLLIEDENAPSLLD